MTNEMTVVEITELVDASDGDNERAVSDACASAEAFELVANPSADSV